MNEPKISGTEARRIRKIWNELIVRAKIHALIGNNGEWLRVNMRKILTVAIGCHHSSASLVDYAPMMRCLRALDSIGDVPTAEQRSELHLALTYAGDLIMSSPPQIVKSKFKSYEFMLKAEVAVKHKQARKPINDPVEPPIKDYRTLGGSGSSISRGRARYG